MKKLEKTGFYTALFGMAIVLIWIGIFKFTPTEAKAIRSLVSHSPFMSWMYGLLSETAVSKLIGSIEIVTGILLLLQPFSARAGVVGGVLAIITFATTLTFIFSTPGAFSNIDGVWIPDQFLLKDLIALGVSLYTIAVSACRLQLNKVPLDTAQTNKIFAVN